jgi:hypothetical protein
MRALLLVTALTAALLLSARASATASPVRILLLENESSGRALEEALRIQLASRAELVIERMAVSESTSERVRSARERLSARGARLALWMDEQASTGDTREAVVYYVTVRGDRALLEIVRVNARASEELYRAVAVKSVEVFQALESYDGDIRASFLSPLPDQNQAAGEKPSPVVHALVELGAYGASGTGNASAQVGAQAGAGVGVRTEHFAGDGVAQARVPTFLVAEGPAGELRARELGFAFEARARWVSGTIAVGATVEAGARALLVDGRTVAGTEGQTVRLIPYLGVGPELQFAVWRSLSLRGAVALEMSLIRQRFSLNGETILDVGRARVVAELGIAASLP